jgi:hypothetical protein
VSPQEDFLRHMASHPLYDEMKRRLLSMRPVIPAHDPGQDNTEQWKSFSAQQKGFDLCCSFFQIHQE